MFLSNWTKKVKHDFLHEDPCAICVLQHGYVTTGHHLLSAAAWARVQGGRGGVLAYMHLENLGTLSGSAYNIHDTHVEELAMLNS